MRFATIALVSFFILSTQYLFSQMPSAEERSVQLSATVEMSPPKINLSWKPDLGASKYIVYRKSLEANSWGEPIANLAGSATTYSDSNVEVGMGYEYAFFKEDFSPRVDVICTEPGTDVTFTINDMYGIGLCCSFGAGSYEVKNCNLVFAEGDDFGYSSSTTFTTCEDDNDCSEVVVTIETDMFENSTSWELKNALTGEVLGSSGPVGSFLKPRPEYGFIYVGIELPAIEDRGKILLLVENDLMVPLATEIEELKTDFIKDGWQVIIEAKDANDSPNNVRTFIQNLYNQEEALKAVFILGHIPIAYSGDIYPDTHSELRGAYPADVFYGEMDGAWTDESVNNTSANFEIYYNTPSDGRFDQDFIPTGEVELQVGRVDFFDMPAFGSSNENLIRNYLQKNHAFKTRQINPIRRGLIDDNFLQAFAAPAASGFRNFSTMFGAESIDQLDYFSTMENESYLWSYGCGGGSIVSSDGIGSTSDFVTSNLQSVFTMLFGSQFGNWAYPDNFLRAPLASGQTLTSVWAGSPPWTLHHMAMGYNIGYSTLKTQNGNDGLYLGNGPQLIHVALMGDPTLRMHMVEAPSNITFNKGISEIEINWLAPIDEEVFGYHIYRAENLDGKFERINSEVITTTTYTDSNPQDGENWYMVRTVKLENSASGSYFNLSLGEINSVDFFLTSNFVSDIQEGCVADPIQFENRSTGNINMFNWIFEGGTPASSTTPNPEVTYNNPGTYDVTLTVTGASGTEEKFRSEYIVMKNVPTPDFNTSIDGNVVTLLDNSLDAELYFWDFGDGNTSQISGDVTHTYEDAGTYVITLVTSNDCGIMTFVKEVNIISTNLNDLEKFEEVVIFPNPTNDILMIDFGKRVNEEIIFEMINSLGQVVFSKKINTPSEVEEVDVSNLSQGIYFIKMKNKSSEMIRRIVVN